MGAWILCFKDAALGEMAMRSIQAVVETHTESYASEGVMLAVDMEGGREEELEDGCIKYGFEYVDYTATGKNEFGEKVGVERIREALEANEWEDQGGEEDDLDLDLENLDLEGGEGLGRDEAEMTAELFGMKAALNGGEQDFDPDVDDVVPNEQSQANQVDDLERIMGRLLAVKEQSTDLPEAQRRRMAAKAVRELFQAGDDGPV